MSQPASVVARLTALTRALFDRRSTDTDPATGAASLDRARPRADRRRQGAYFTPIPLVRFTVAETLRARLTSGPVTWRDDGTPTLRILDPCAGDGRFLAAAGDFLAEWSQTRHPGSDQSGAEYQETVRAAITRRCLIAIERDPEFAEQCRERLGPDATVVADDALQPRGPQVAQAVAEVDVVVSNPPYVRSVNMAPDEREALAGRYAATSFGEWDLYMAFLEQTYQWLAPHGQAGLVVPSRWFTAATATRLRELLARAGAMRMLIDFGATQVFAQATTYTSISFLSQARSPEVLVARRALGAEADASSGDQWRCDQLPAATLSHEPWRLVVGADRSLVQHLMSGPKLGDIARIAKGVGTNADRVYILERATVVGEIVRGHCRAADGPVELERALCRPCVRGRDIRAYGQIDGSVQCLTPYRRDGARLSADDLARFPRADAHLKRFRTLLANRESGKYDDPAFYRFGRAQNLEFLGRLADKIIIPDVAKSGRAVLDATGALVLDSAYAIRLLPGAQGYALELLLAVMHAPVVRYWLTRTGISLRGGYVRLKTSYLSPLPLPRLSEHTERACALVRAGRATGHFDAAAIDRAMQSSYGLDDDTWRRMQTG